MEKSQRSASAKLAVGFPGKAVGVRIRGQAVVESAAPAETKEDADADDDLDLFDDEIEEEKKAAEQREATKASSAKKRKRATHGAPIFIEYKARKTEAISSAQANIVCRISKCDERTRIAYTFIGQHCCTWENYY